ncbi:MAG: hypothetical protein A2312_00265 [Candidatus Staskawiczbacteria bacterium RIFOXYB2_FULL_32_9]|uniref:HMA domain-containing protein n=1 Tax=Candidatus Staskawiczbacteria bacterium RIFOXYD1_FULL_32_13 TaxID=1802234 RepID=A0A1G2JJU9_9BACT|nr:MAG: Mercuric transport system [Parcubacteria group bacterium GW2011_GWC2_32_10]OGZ79491.1 MAG: hypothetical protein A2360_02175 [Candidatus Staskawiczbacteria bacterium RIFOXYB1_FULL_32_11]OGZ79561.1 MAG: hypothetical protein A2256_00905 [Candidatus Staskawiczbacteria bacterium RIFOXYA2_FULL_32_7]OGZ84859.1 MAG: hypothetical protein A2312_00265 [Candidatus Staskawiczbacteria bacterium RIFOXYB2_FULL_32_9]OGZ85440.1 MAG: hypothetical protein A2463_04310 [Candidatus Staskawiczbacteria bacteriu
MEKIILNISGMHCASCAKIIEMMFPEKTGVSSIVVNYESGKAFLEFDSSRITAQQIKAVINEEGYKVT